MGDGRFGVLFFFLQVKVGGREVCRVPPLNSYNNSRKIKKEKKKKEYLQGHKWALSTAHRLASCSLTLLGRVLLLAAFTCSEHNGLWLFWKTSRPCSNTCQGWTLNSLLSEVTLWQWSDCVEDSEEAGYGLQLQLHTSAWTKREGRNGAKYHEEVWSPDEDSRSGQVSFTQSIKKYLLYGRRPNFMWEKKSEIYKHLRDKELH